MRPRTVFFAAALALAFVETFVVVSEPFWIIEFFRPASASDVNSIVSGFNVASLVVDPVVVFLVMFSLGRRLAATVELPSVLVWVLLGAVIGTYGCLAGITAHAYLTGLLQPFIPQLTLDLLYDAFGALRLSLVAFASLTFAYFVSRSRAEPVQIVP